MNTYDHYEDARQVVALLKGEGFPDQAQQIGAAMTDGKTGTEIFMILRFRLKPLLDLDGIPESTRQRMQLLYSKVNEALK